MNSVPTVSICVPAHNAGLFIDEALRSILAQTFHDFELIVLDDASTDDTASKVLRLKDPRLRYERNSANLGGYQTMNRAVSLATGRLVAIYHADDVYKPTIVEREVEYLRAHPESGAVFTQNDMIDAHGSLLGTNKLPSGLTGRETFRYEEVFRFLLRNKNILLCCPTFMARRSVLDEVGPFDAERYDIAADLDMWIRVLRVCPIGIIDEPLMKYRHTSSQWSDRYRRLRTDQELYFDIMDRYLEQDAWRGRLPADDLLENEFHRVDDRTFRAANSLLLSNLDSARSLLACAYPWASLVKRPTRRKVRVLALRGLLKLGLALGLSTRLAPLVRRMEYPESS